LTRIQYRLATRTTADAQAFCDLSNSLYARKVSPAYFEWQFFDNPNDPQLIFMCDGERIIGAFGLHLVGNGGDRRAMCLDIMIAAAEQGRGLIAGLANHAVDRAREAGAGHIGVVGNEKARAALSRHLGWTLVKAIRAHEISVGRLPTTDRPCEILEEVPPTRSSAPSFYARTPEYLTWRTRRNPRYSYVWMQTGDAFAVTKLFKDPVSGRCYGDVLEIFSDDVSGNAYRSHLLTFCCRLKDMGATTLSVVPGWAEQVEAVETAGFAPGGPHRYAMTPDSLPYSIGMLDIDVF
jgi:GNAT superfamily N-acetyltransferase